MAARRAAARWESALLALLFAAGVAHWLAFFALGGGPSFTVADWPKEYRYYAALQQALAEGRIPYYVSRPIHETRKLLSLPELSWSPQVVLLSAVDVGTFVALNTALLYAAGFAGCLLLRRRYGLSPLPFVLLFLLVSFNGNVAAHLAVGHSMWTGCFLLPLFALFLLELVEDGSRRAPLLLALVMFAMLLQGSFHVFVWCVLFLLLLAAFHRGRRRAAAAALLWAFALGACRLAPAAVVLLGRRQQPFMSGFPFPLTLLEALALIRPVNEPARGGSFDTLRWWEYDAYVGAAALVWLVWFGLYRRIRDTKTAPVKDAAPGAARAGWGLDGPLAVMALLALDDLYYPINALGLPLLGSQRVSSRLLIVPLVFLFVLAAVRTQRALEETARPGRLRLLLLACALMTTGSLALHSWTWRVSAVEAAWPRPPHPRDLAIEVRPGSDPDTARDQPYLLSVRVSAAVSLAALGALNVRLWRLRGRSSGARRGA